MSNTALIGIIVALAGISYQWYLIAGCHKLLKKSTYLFHFFLSLLFIPFNIYARSIGMFKSQNAYFSDILMMPFIFLSLFWMVNQLTLRVRGRQFLLGISLMETRREAYGKSHGDNWDTIGSLILLFSNFAILVLLVEWLNANLG